MIRGGAETGERRGGEAAKRRKGEKAMWYGGGVMVVAVRRVEVAVLRRLRCGGEQRGWRTVPLTFHPRCADGLFFSEALTGFFL